MKRIILISLILFSCFSWVFAEKSTEKDYSTVKGDYKILCLQDTRDVINDKLIYLSLKGQIYNYAKKDGSGFFVSNFFDNGEDAFVYCKYYEEKLSAIIFLPKNHYTARDVEGKIKNIIYNNLKPIFEKNYGKPTEEMNYPTAAEVYQSDRRVLVWETDKKTITISVSQYKFTFNPMIIIRDKMLTELRKNNDESKKKNDIESKANDF